MSRAVFIKSLHLPVAGKRWRFHLPHGAIRVAFTRLVLHQELFFTEMTKKMAHVCENYDNWFINQLTTNKHVVFVEFLRG
jgi:hypothetical protein